MQDYQQRVVDEQNELDEKARKLDAFLMSDKSSGLHPDERTRMVRQLQVMQEYSGILGERIAAFV